MRRADFPRRFAPLVPLVTAFTVGLTLATASAVAQETTSDTELASVDWPPPGPRLRELTRRLDIEIGFAARRDWQLQLPDENGASVSGIYGDIASAEFGILTPEASFRLEYTQPEEGRFDFGGENDLDSLLDFADSHDMRVFGVPLTWYFNTPDWLAQVPAERMAAVLDEHVRTVVSRYAGRVPIWGVVNEALDEEGTGFRAEDPFYAALGPEFLDIAFKAARAVDPGATLLYNDFNIGWLTPKSALALDLVDDMLARSVPIDGIGMQMHIEHTFVHFEGLSEAMQRFVDRDLDVYLSELDVGVLAESDYGVQSDVYEEVIRRCLMQPRCEAVNIWGINDYFSWRPFFDPLPFDGEFRAKPAYFGIRRALMTQPVHPESCTLGDARVSRGTVYAADAASSATGLPGGAFSIACEAVPLDGGFTSLAVRYRNTGTDTPELEISAGDVPLATLALAPVPLTNEGDYRTLRVTVPALAGTTDLTMRVGAVSDGGEVGIDALLFGDPTRPLPVVAGPVGETDGGIGDGTDGGTAGGTDGGAAAGPDGEVDGGTGTDTETGDGDDGGRGLGGIGGAFWSIALGGILWRRRRTRQVPASKR